MANLQESGTNKIDIMAFNIYDKLYGIDTAKVREIMLAGRVKPIPHTHPAVEGIYKPRNIMMMLVDLPFYLSGVHTEKQDKDLFVITKFDKLHIGFRVHSIFGITGIFEKNMQKPDSAITYDGKDVAACIVQYDDNPVTENTVLLTHITECELKKAGFVNIIKVANGEEAWNYLIRMRDGDETTKPVSLIIAEMEMPEMDGHQLTKLVKSDDVLKGILW